MEDIQTTKLFKEYQVMMRLFREHFKKCKTFQKQVLDSGEFEFDD